MKTVFIIYFLVFNNLLDTAPGQVSWNPYYPNYGITVEQLSNEGFIEAELEHGGCSFERTKNKKNYLVFYSEETSECNVIKHQEVYISLSDSITLDAVINTNRKIIPKDSVTITEILDTFESKKISQFKKIDPCIYTFRAKNIEGKILEWNVFMCNKDLILNVSADLNQ